MLSKSELITELQNKIGDLDNLFVKYFVGASIADVEWTKPENKTLDKMAQTIGSLQNDVIYLEELGYED